jgi:hypothetical protein
MQLFKRGYYFSTYPPLSPLIFLEVEILLKKERLIKVI